MTTAEFWQRGEALDYTNSGTDTIPAGAIFELGTMTVVAGCDIEPGEVGTIHLGGVWKVKKTGTSAIGMLEPVYFDGSGITGDAGSGSSALQAIGIAAAPAAAEDEIALVRLRG